MWLYFLVLLKCFLRGMCAYKISGENIDFSLWIWFQGLDWFSLNTLSLKEIQPFISKWHLKQILLYINLVNSIVIATVYVYYTYWTGSSISYRINGWNRKKLFSFFQTVSITSCTEHQVYIGGKPCTNPYHWQRDYLFSCENYMYVLCFLMETSI